MLFKAQLFSNKKGFTLVELMVGLVVAMIVMGMTYSIFTSQLRLTGTEMRINELQLNTQMTLRYLSKKLRNLGYGVTTKIPVPAIMWYDGDQASTTTGNTGGNGPGGAPSESANIWPDDNLQYSDILAWFSASVPTTMTVLDYNESSQELKLKKPTLFDDTDGPENGNAYDPYIGGLLLVFDETNGTYTIIQITSIGENQVGFTSIVFNPGWGDNLNTGLPFIPNGAIYLGDFNLMYVDNNNVLRIVTPAIDDSENIPLMTNVLSMQVQMGLDTDGDNQVDTWTFDSNDVTNLYEVKAAKIYIFTATSQEEKGVSVNVLDMIERLDTNGVWSQEVDWDSVVANFQEVHGSVPGVPRVYTFGCQFRNVFTCTVPCN